MTIKKLQSGFRIHARIFIPIDTSDPASVQRAAQYANELKTLQALPDAPEGTVIEDFSFRHGKQKI